MNANTFKNWVRIQLDNAAFQNSNGFVEGSRASPKYDWHMVSYLRNAGGPFLEVDENEVSATAPLRATAGNGTMSIFLLDAATTMGYRAVYDAANFRWTLEDSSGATAFESKQSAPEGTVWVIPLADRVTVQIVQGSEPFADGDEFRFSTFKTSAPQGKVNRIAEGYFEVEGLP